MVAARGLFLSFPKEMDVSEFVIVVGKLTCLSVYPKMISFAVNLLVLFLQRLADANIERDAFVGFVIAIVLSH